MSLKCKKFANHLDVKNKRRKGKKIGNGSFEIRMHSLDRNPNLQKVLIIAALARPCLNREMIYVWHDLDKATPSGRRKLKINIWQ